MILEFDNVKRELGLVPLPSEEGGLYHQTYRDANSSAIYYAIGGEHFSAMHRLVYPEIWHFYAGAPVRMLLLDPNGHVAEPRLGIALAEGEGPQVIVPSHTWQGARSAGEWSLVGTTMAPGYTKETFELGKAAALVQRYPTARDRIVELARA